MAAPEKTKCYNLIKKHLPGVFSRIENICELGMPDVNGTYQGHDYWIETKYCKNRLAIRPVEKLLRPDQRNWHKRRTKAGAIIFVIVRYSAHLLVYRYIINNIYHIFEYQMMYVETVKSFDWKRFEQLLQNEILGAN